MNDPASFDWTDARKARCCELWTLGKSAREIAADLDPSGKLTRSAVLGKIHRLGLPRRAEDEGRIHAARNRHAAAVERRAAKQRERTNRPIVIKVAKTNPVKVKPVLVEVSNLRTVSMDDCLNSHCKWPLGDYPHLLFCAEPKDGKLFCTTHKAVGVEREQPALKKLPGYAPRPGSKTSGLSLRTWGLG